MSPRRGAREKERAYLERLDVLEDAPPPRGRDGKSGRTRTPYPALPRQRGGAGVKGDNGNVSPAPDGSCFLHGDFYGECPECAARTAWSLRVCGAFETYYADSSGAVVHVGRAPTSVPRGRAHPGTRQSAAESL